MTVSVSSDGKYAISSHQNNELVLWDIENKKNSLIHERANIYSAYFIKKSNLFLWQNLNNTVLVTNIRGENVESFPLDYPTYGHKISKNLKSYLSVSEENRIGYGLPLEQKTIKAAGGSFIGLGKLLNISWNEDKNILVTSGFATPNAADPDFEPLSEQEKDGYKDLEGVVLWDITARRALAKFPGNAAKTFATLSPDGQYVVSNDENGRGRVWMTKTYELVIPHLASLYHGLIVNPDANYKEWKRDKTNLIPIPKDYLGENTIAVKFINNDQYLRIVENNHYAILYDVTNPLPLKYLGLGTSPYPATDRYDRNTAIDTAPEVGVLVAGHKRDGGISVYQYDRDTQSLKTVWVVD